MGSGVNYYRYQLLQETKISGTSQNEAINDCDDPFSDLKDELEELDSRDSSLVSGVTVETFIDIDENLQSSNAHLTDEDSLIEVVGDPDDDLHDINYEDEILDESLECPKSAEVMSALETLSMFGMFTDAAVNDDVMSLTCKIKKLLINRRKQKKNFFSRL